ncbi:helix-turn-helix domain-containing protein [Priestia megaterium]|uniref:helix-turn-helix domain-containing protein n=1 Tax=Priestia megaterium TaxID=1404 RepID=UPI0008DFED00|nr:helix-turn-helix domain-containing protein [Priestia megaterium]MDH3141970.1 helix-turn-helix domain-containing protein [Priestia megaterium]MED4236896.1 helix-turn-helix domain-containing protein [Priestia megaterium]MED4252938.1 helix-turn-helix domain-containing protein [Priestia megaterium]MED4265942.1 helix-turn-helix domain-containing protein [Priestia megaterium]MED4275266.1 helix-turn-helix domain-containing protein [Priestia megaterium]
MGKHHDKDFKMHAARLVIEKGRKPRELAEELNISVPTLRNWINIYKEKRESELKFIEKCYLNSPVRYKIVKPL